MKRQILCLLVGSLFLTGSWPVFADSGQECAAQCSNDCSGQGTERDDQRYEECLNSCMDRCFAEPVDVPEVPEPSPAN